jgi:haloalkane dehalogenase
VQYLMPAQGSAQVLSLVVFGTVATWYLVPWLKTRGRVDALESGKSPAYAYRFVDHARYLDAWFEALHLTSNVTLVVHDWGSALGFHRTTRYPEQITAIAYMEAITMPLRWEDCGEARGIFQALRSPQGEPMIFNENVFVEAVLPRSVLRTLTDQEMAAYRTPFLERDARRPTLVWPRQIPIEGEPADVMTIVDRYGKAMSQSALPKLLIVGEPGALLKGRTLEFCRTWSNQTEVTVSGVHFLQEDSPDEIGQALQAFVKSVPSTVSPPARWSSDGSIHVTAPRGRECLRTGGVNAKSTQQPSL